VLTIVELASVDATVSGTEPSMGGPDNDQAVMSELVKTQLTLGGGDRHRPTNRLASLGSGNDDRARLMVDLASFAKVEI